MDASNSSKKTGIMKGFGVKLLSKWAANASAFSCDVVASPLLLFMTFGIGDFCPTIPLMFLKASGPGFIDCSHFK